MNTMNLNRDISPLRAHRIPDDALELIRQLRNELVKAQEEILALREQAAKAKYASVPGRDPRVAHPNR